MHSSCPGHLYGQMLATSKHLEAIHEIIRPQLMFRPSDGQSAKTPNLKLLELGHSIQLFSYQRKSFLESRVFKIRRIVAFLSFKRIPPHEKKVKPAYFIKGRCLRFLQLQRKIRQGFEAVNPES